MAYEPDDIGLVYGASTFASLPAWLTEIGSGVTFAGGVMTVSANGRNSVVSTDDLVTLGVGYVRVSGHFNPSGASNMRGRALAIYNSASRYDGLSDTDWQEAKWESEMMEGGAPPGLTMRWGGADQSDYGDITVNVPYNFDHTLGTNPRSRILSGADWSLVLHSKTSVGGTYSQKPWLFIGGGYAGFSIGTLDITLIQLFKSNLVTIGTLASPLNDGEYIKLYNAADTLLATSTDASGGTATIDMSNIDMGSSGITGYFNKYNSDDEFLEKMPKYDDTFSGLWAGSIWPGSDDSTPPVYGILRRWDGASWVFAVIQAYHNSGWMIPVLWYYDGATWHEIQMGGGG